MFFQKLSICRKLWMCGSFIWYLIFVNIGYANSSIQNTIPEIFISMEPLNNHIIIVEKSTQQLFLYKYDGKYEKLMALECSTGKVPGDKSESGDKKTPEGVYFCTKEFKKRDLSPIYGTRAFPIDYPNWLDRAAGKNGNAIWIHGTNKKLKMRDSNGCIALNNTDINQLSDYISLNRTPVILVDKLSFVPEDSVQQIKMAVTSFLEKWSASLINGTIEGYLACYADECQPDKGWLADFQFAKERIERFGKNISIAIDNISAYRHNGVIVVLFDQVLRSSGKSFQVGTRKIFIKNDENGFKIIGDEYQKLNEKYDVAYNLHESPEVAILLSWENDLKSQKEILAMIEDWRNAWSSKNLVAYGNHYAENFHSNGMNRSAWLRYKRELNKKYQYIQVEIDDLAISKEKNRSTVTFIQIYKSNILCDTGSKKLVLKLEGGKWKIMREIWKKG